MKKQTKRKHPIHWALVKGRGKETKKQQNTFQLRTGSGDYSPPPGSTGRLLTEK
uniref:Uncharacterized protein n=1 Tax=Anguilla anguilla TaxID=7936 RepID=A0A0E9WYV7_ANGAN